MYLDTLFEAQERVIAKRIRPNDIDTLETASELINEYNQLAWKLNARRLITKIGSNGVFYILQAGGEIVGTIAIKQTEVEGYNAGEVGYLVIREDHRTLKNLMLLYRAVAKHTKNFDFVFMTSQFKNKTMTKLLSKSNNIEFSISAKSQFSSNLLNYWVFRNGDMSIEEVTELLKTHVGHRLR